MSTIYVWGDPHGQFDQYLHLIKKDPGLAMILLGDLDLKAPLQDVP